MVLHPRIKYVVQTVLPQVQRRQNPQHLRELVLLLHPQRTQLCYRVDSVLVRTYHVEEEVFVKAILVEDFGGEVFVFAYETEDGFAEIFWNIFGLANFINFATKITLI